MYSMHITYTNETKTVYIFLKEMNFIYYSYRIPFYVRTVIIIYNPSKGINYYCHKCFESNIAMKEMYNNVTYNILYGVHTHN